MIVNFKKSDERAITPMYAHPYEDAGMDVVATSVKYDEEMDCYVYGTGLHFEVPQGYVMLIFPRSSNRKTQCYMANSVGVLDSGYRGELMLSFKPRTSRTLLNFFNWLYNKVTDTNWDRFEALKKAPYEIGDRIGQIMILPYPEITFREVQELSDSLRGEGGHGSTGK